MQGANDMIHFGIQSNVIGWTDEDGRELEALCLQRIVTQRMSFIEYFQKEPL